MWIVWVNICTVGFWWFLIRREISIWISETKISGCPSGGECLTYNFQCLISGMEVNQSIVYVSHCTNPHWPKSYCTKDSLFASATSLQVVFLHCHLCARPVVVQLIDMASSDDAEGSLTPVDFIQLQHYMECKFHHPTNIISTITCM